MLQQFSSNRILRRAGFAAVLLGGSTLAGAGIVAAHAQVPAATPDTPAGTPGPIHTTGVAHPLPDFSDLAAQVSPAVVSVTVREHPTNVADQEGGPEGMQGGMPGFMMPHMQPQQRRVMMARGSGFIINSNGTIVTNNHVVKGADKVTVTLTDGTELPAKVVGTDPRTDLAVIKVNAGHALPSLNLGNSDDVKPGQWVLAVGNPFGLGGTVTAGIVSARGRDIGAGPYDSFLQVDAAINQGNSGGPLFTQDGKVVGVNTAILSPSGGSVGIGFAIPSNLVKTISQQLIADGHVTRGFLGVETQPVTSQIAPGLGLDKNAKGALVASVSPDSPAAKAGLQPGDVLTSVDGHAVASPRELAQMVANDKPGDEAQIALIRDGSNKTLSVKLASMPDQQQTADAGQQDDQHQGRIGLALAPLNPDLREQLQLPERARGAVVAGVQPGSAAEQAGLREGDLVIGVGSKAVTSPSEAVAAIRTATKAGHGVDLRIMRDGQAQFVAVSPNSEG
jgi:serine protease Do